MYYNNKQITKCKLGKVGQLNLLIKRYSKVGEHVYIVNVKSEFYGKGGPRTLG